MESRFEAQLRATQLWIGLVTMPRFKNIELGSFVTACMKNRDNKNKKKNEKR